MKKLHNTSLLLLILFVPILLNGQSNVGIGIENPMSKLHLSTNSSLNYPQLRLTEQGVDYARLKMESDAQPGVFWDIAARADSVLTDSKLNFFYLGPNGVGDLMTIRGNGRIGINNVNPEAKLDIKGGDWNLEAGNPGDLRVGNSTYNLRIGVATGGGGAGIARIFAGGGQSRLVFGTDSTRRLTILDNGNIGVGLDNPLEKLHINGSFRVSDLSGTGDRNVIVDENGKFKIGALGEGDSDWAETADAVYNNSHDIGIGTSYPATKLHIVNGLGEAGHLKLSVPLGGPFNSNGRTMTLGGDFINVEGTIFDNLRLQETSAGNIYMVGGGGNVGIGTTFEPSAKLTVEGLDNDGETAALEIRSTGSEQIMFLDGNEIDVAGTSQILHLNANSGKPVSIGSFDSANGYMLSVDGNVIAEEVRVQLSTAWPDYVFEPNYKLASIYEVEQNIKDYGHLPGIPPASQIDNEGLDVGDMQKRMMEKIEELTLYLIDQQKEIDRLKEIIKK